MRSLIRDRDPFRLGEKPGGGHCWPLPRNRSVLLDGPRLQDDRVAGHRSLPRQSKRVLPPPATWRTITIGIPPKLAEGIQLRTQTQESRRAWRDEIGNVRPGVGHEFDGHGGIELEFIAASLACLRENDDSNTKGTLCR